ncbi:hypothetical protein ACNHKD_02855 [Methylocystis sp. JAN1]|jgi:hypothetical protein|uniref:hypothetical protein n=1 Tax=Methylocystis sp. JAN1 TaxID=3397211 RepID=UPI003FA1C5E0
MLKFVSSVLVATVAMHFGILPPVIQIRLDSLNSPTLWPIPEGEAEVVTGRKNCKGYGSIF